MTVAARPRPPLRPFSRAARERAAATRRPPRALLAVGLAIAGFALLPLVYLVIRAAGIETSALEFLLRPRTVGAVVATLVLGATVGAASIALGVPVAWLTARSDIPGRRMWAVLTVVPLALPSYVVGFAFVQIFYFISIGRLPVGVALLIEYTAPILIALWARFGEKQPLRKRFWAALALAMLGLAMVAQVFDSDADIDGLGVAAGFAAALALALYFILGDRIISSGRRDAISLTCWAFGFASLFLAVVFPWWTFPFGELAGSTTLLEGLPAIPIWALALWLVVLGTILPFTLIIASLSHLTATGSSVVGMLEPVLAAVVAWILLGEVLAGVQIVGGIVVLVGVLLAETSRAGAVRRAAEESAPAN